MLWLYSDASLSTLKLWSRRILGKMVAAALYSSNNSVMPCLNRVQYVPISTSVRVKGEPIVDESSPEVAEDNWLDFCSGVMAAFLQYVNLAPEDAPKFLKTVLPESIDGKFSGLVVGLGLMGKYSQLSAVEMMALLLCGHGLTEATSLLAISCNPNIDAKPSLMRILKVTLSEGPLNMETRMEIQIEAEMRMIAPLALGLVMAGTGDQTSLSLLQRLILGRIGSTLKGFDTNTFVLHCGIAMALINSKDEPELHPHEVSALMQYISYSSKDHASSVATACLLALLPLFHASEITTSPPFSLERLSFSDYLLYCCARIFSEKRTRCDFEKLIQASLPHDHQLGLEPLLELSAEFLCFGISHFASPFHLADILPHIPALIMRIRQEYSTPCLSYRSRYRRVVLSLCHDLILFSASLAGCGGGCQTILRLVSDTFADHLDYSFSKSHTLSLTIALLVLSEEMMKRIHAMPAILRCIIFIISVVPMAPDVQFFSSPVHHCRLLVPLAFLFQNRQASTRTVNDDGDTFFEGNTTGTAFLDQMLRDPSVLKKATSLEDVIQLSLVGIR